MFSVKGLLTTVSIMGTELNLKTLPVHQNKIPFYLLFGNSLNPEQYHAALELLSSAKNYQGSYQKNRLIR